MATITIKDPGDNNKKMPAIIKGAYTLTMIEKDRLRDGEPKIYIIISGSTGKDRDVEIIQGPAKTETGNWSFEVPAMSSKAMWKYVEIYNTCTYFCW